MIQYPEITDNYFKEKEGIIQVQSQLNRMKLIFRETPHSDIGIDGQIEYVNKLGKATGKIVAVQIKSGASHITEHEDHWAYYPSTKHRNYWEVFPIPVFLMIYLPVINKTFFTDARQALNSPNYKYNYIAIPKANILEATDPDTLFETLGNTNEPFLPIDEVLVKMAFEKNSNPTFAISFFDLFSFGLINISRQIFFSMSLATELAELANETEWGMGVGEDEQNFLHSYARFLLNQNLAKIDYADYLIDWKERFIQPMFIAPLTSRGRQLRELISEKEKQFLGQTELTRERLIGNINNPNDGLRFQHAKRFTSILLGSNPS